ncbi:nipblb [Symbiodinium natans]|uniref:Nipblb protein n=1 Tax=Symbiodinium natans TaxID=878477 RepID=A0A812RZU8_9DINO|nr:nipblb [Symbiodinium natans]
MASFDYVVRDLLLHERSSFLDVLHIYDDKKDYLPPEYRKEHLRAVVYAKLLGWVTLDRFVLNWKEKVAQVSQMICDHFVANPATFVCMGFRGRKGKKDVRILTSNIYEVLRVGRKLTLLGMCSLVIFKEPNVCSLPMGRPAKFLVSMSLNKAASKAFLDALRLSKPGDEIHLIYVTFFTEDQDSDHVKILRDRYSHFFEGLGDGDHHVLQKFFDRHIEFHIVPQHKGELIPQTVAGFAESIEADFVVVGTNALRVDRGKEPLGSASLQICMEAHCTWFANASSCTLPTTFSSGLEPRVNGTRC